MTDGIAIVGMAGRFPKADGPQALWENLRRGVDCITRFSDEDLEFALPAGHRHPGSVMRARGILEDAAMFDAEFFGVPVGDAVLMDPQHRIFLECCHEAIESAGYDPAGLGGPTGIYGGSSLNTYLLHNLNGASGMAGRLATHLHASEFAALLGNDKDYLVLRVAHKLGLRGPALAVQTACSTSLVAVCEACTALRTYQCDTALAGGVSITFPQRREALVEPGGMMAPDGVCRAFDAGARGTVFGHGAGVVLLKRESEAVRDGDAILAVIRGWGVNNDGADKVGFAAPSLNGQAEAIAMALASAEFDAEDISYVEAHGTGTALGDPVEVDIPQAVRTVVEGLSGSQIADPDRTFESLGLDSLLLAQVATAIFRRLGTEVSFRELLNNANSLTKLTALVREKHAESRLSATPTASVQRPMGIGEIRRPGPETVGDASPPRILLPRPTAASTKGSLTARQREALDKLIARYTRRTAASKAYTARHRPHFADPRAVSGFRALWKDMVYPIVSKASKGSRLQDLDGNSFIDLTMGFGTYFFGHSPDWLIEALHAQLDRGIEIGPQSDLADSVAEDLCALTGMERATFCNTGSEAVMAAMRVARTVTGRDRIAYFAGDYHGMFDEALVRGSWADGHYRPAPVAPGIPDASVENILVLPYGATESLEILHRHAGEIAAILVEPVQSRNTSLQPAAFLDQLRDLDVGVLKRSLHLLVCRHAALRSVFCEDFETQLYPPAPKDLEIPIEDLRLLPESARPFRYSEILREAVGRPFDLHRGPLLRLGLVQLADTSISLIWTAHHLVCDGWSLGMLVEELSKAYNAFRAGRVPLLPPPRTFGGFARHLDSEKDGAAASDSKNYWLSVLSDPPPPLDLPTVRARAPIRSFSGGMESLALDPALASRLPEAFATQGGTLFSGLLAAFASLLSRIAGQEDIVIGVPSASQPVVGCDALIGHCLNLLPLRLRVPADAEFGKLTAATQAAVLEAYEHRELTFGSLLRDLALPRDASRSPLVSVMFNIDRSGFEHLHFEDLAFSVRTNPKRSVNFDLFFNLVRSESAIRIECEFNSDLFDAATVRGWMEAYTALIETAVNNPNVVVSKLPLLTSGQRDAALSLARGPSRAYPDKLPVHALVSQSAALHATKTAARCGKHSLTYSELEEWSDRIASRLATMGVAPGNLVGVYADRGLPALAGFLGIWKAGAAYVPMDPAFPRQRLEWMVEDSEMVAVLTERHLVGAVSPNIPRSLVLDDPLPAVAVDYRPSREGGEALAYVMFTSGSTGRPKGVQIPHRAVVNFLESMKSEPGFEAADTLLAGNSFRPGSRGKSPLAVMALHTVTFGRMDSLQNGLCQIPSHRMSASTSLATLEFTGQTAHSNASGAWTRKRKFGASESNSRKSKFISLHTPRSPRPSAPPETDASGASCALMKKRMAGACFPWIRNSPPPSDSTSRKSFPTT